MLLSWKIGGLPAGTERSILVKVKPTQVAPMDHGATVTFQAGSRARSRVLQPKLRVEVVQAPSFEKVLKGKTAGFRISVTNTGSGPRPRRGRAGQAWTGTPPRERREERGEQLRPAAQGDRPGPSRRAAGDGRRRQARGSQVCVFKATSPDVIFDPAEAQVEKTVEVIQPKLKLTLDAPAQRYTDTIATYTLTVENPGTSPAKGIRLLSSLPVSGKLVSASSNGRYDPATRRISWSLPQLGPSEKPQSFTFRGQDRRASASTKSPPKPEPRTPSSRAAGAKTDVQGMADLDLVVRERQVSGSTWTVPRPSRFVSATTAVRTLPTSRSAPK